MKLLIDTHVWLWMQSEPERIAPAVQGLLVAPQNTVLLSIASVWEIGIKWSLGKLPLPDEPSHYIPRALQRQAVDSLAVSLAHALEITRFEKHHRDPFDHLLIAQARIDDLTLVTADRLFENYAVSLIWA
jgi:PIN domain nuclease of toxin-antitoxin system